MSAGTVAGTFIRISAGVPATFDAAGYAALKPFARIGEITDGGEHGREYAGVNHNPIDTRGTAKFKGSFNEGAKTLQLAIDPDDPGQALAKIALNSDNNYSFEVEYPDGGFDYFQAQVMSFKKATGSVDSMISGTITLEITTSKEGVGIVEVPPPPANATLTYTAGANGTLIGTSPQTVPRMGSGSPVAAVPSAGFEFVQWSDGSTANPRVDTNVLANVTVTATFQPE